MADWPGIIKSIQRGTITLSPTEASITATITEVDMGNSRLKKVGNRTDAATAQYGCPRLNLTNSTTITATRGDGTLQTLIVNYEIIEYYPGFIKRIQRGNITLAIADNTETATVTEVNTNKTELENLGFSSSIGGTYNDTTYNLSLTNSTTITAQRSGTAPALTCSYELVEWY